MANDIKITYNYQTQEFDFKYNNGDLLRDDGLETAVLISLFTDRKADEDDNLINQGDFRGWWGDLLGDEGQMGSKLWLLKGSKVTNQNIVLAKQYIEEALQWMIDDGVIAKIDVETEAQGAPENKVLAARIRLYYNDGNVKAIEFINLWEAQIAIS